MSEEKVKLEGVKDKPTNEPSYGKTFTPKYFPKFEADLPRAEGKNIVITGTTTGTGFIAAKTLLKKGATVALLNRNEEKARKALAEFFETQEGTEERTHFVVCDLQDFESVKSAAEEVSKLFEEGIDVIVNNAGVMALEDKATKDGYDVQIQTNHLSHFLLTKLLFPLLEKRGEEAGQARVVNHSSVVRLSPGTLKARYFKKNGGKLGGNGTSNINGGRWVRYHQSKLANSVFTVALQKKLTKGKSKVICVCAHPGVAATNLQLTTAKDGGLKSLGFMNSAQSQEDGSMGLLKCTLDPKVKKGGLYGPRGLTGKPKHVFHGIQTTARAGRMLWKESENACGEFIIGGVKEEAKEKEEEEEEGDEEIKVEEEHKEEKEVGEGEEEVHE